MVEEIYRLKKDGSFFDKFTVEMFPIPEDTRQGNRRGFRDIRKFTDTNTERRVDLDDTRSSGSWDTLFDVKRTLRVTYLS